MRAFNSESPIYLRYINWLRDQVSLEPYYSKLSEELFRTEFYWFLGLDGDRREEGIGLQYQFGEETGYSQHSIYEAFNGCSVLEMMVALAIRIERYIMHDDDYGDRTSLWFHEMLRSLGLDVFIDNNFDAEKVSKILEAFMERNYEPNGAGGLFTVPDYQGDMRAVEIGDQANLYLNYWARQEGVI